MNKTGDISPTREEKSMKRRTFLTAAGATIVGLRLPIHRALADEKVIRFAMPQDFTRVYTFVTVEYSQGQRDYISLINAKGGINGYQIVADISDHGNDLPRALAGPIHRTCAGFAQ